MIFSLLRALFLSLTPTSPILLFPVSRAPSLPPSIARFLNVFRILITQTLSILFFLNMVSLPLTLSFVRT